jgi:UDP-N-acetylmuramate--alanine ligase
LNNIEFDHPDYFRNAAAYRRVFADFIKKIPQRGFLVISAGDRETKKIRNKTKGKVISCGLNRKEKPDYLATGSKRKGSGQAFRVQHGKKDLGEFNIRLIGEHNVLNALLVIAAAERLGVKMTAIKKALGSFSGTARRMEVLGKYHGALIIDDYAHHPTEVKATLKGVRGHYKDKNIITVFHPHTFTRTKALFKDFVTSFSDTDELVILDIYGSAREKQGGVSSAQLVKAIKEHNKRIGKKQAIRNIKTLKEATLYLKEHLKQGDLLLLMGAGDVFRVGESLFKKRDQ